MLHSEAKRLVREACHKWGDTWIPHELGQVWPVCDPSMLDVRLELGDWQTLELARSELGIDQPVVPSPTDVDHIVREIADAYHDYQPVYQVYERFDVHDPFTVPHEVYDAFVLAILHVYREAMAYACVTADVYDRTTGDDRYEWDAVDQMYWQRYRRPNRYA